ncbi:transglutaminase-like enzymes, putative cysteine proteases [Lachnospiraceae bacterium KM106-2]|nr:transglutaminase-like enzymes, putative cysteine proteases [Lachnospiraceae bacterium KM106-2]
MGAIGGWLHRMFYIGACHIYNVFLIFYNEYYKDDQKTIKLAHTGVVESTTLIVCYVGILMTMLLGYLLLRHRQAIYYFFLSIPFVFLPYIVGLLPSQLPFYCYIITSIIIAAAMLGYGKVKVYDHSITLRINLIMTVLTLAVFSVGYMIVTPKRYESMNVVAIKKTVQENIRNHPFGSAFSVNPFEVIFTKNHTASGGMSGGALGEKEGLEFTGKTMLKVRIENGEKKDEGPIYLKGYVGEIYNHNEWNPLSEKEQQNLNRLDMEYTNELDTLQYYFLDGVPSLQGSNETISIDNVGNTEDVLFTPYFSCTHTKIKSNGYQDASEEEILKEKHDNHKTVQQYNKPKEYVEGTIPITTTGKAFEENKIAEILAKYSFEKYIIEKSNGKNVYHCDPDNAYINEELYDSVINMPEVQNWTNDDNLAGCVDYFEPGEAIYELKNVMSNQIEFQSKAEKLIHKYYTQLPKESLNSVKKLVRDWYLDKSSSRNLNDESLNYAFHMFESYEQYDRYVQAIQKVKDYLNDNTTYSLHPGGLPTDEDFVENFLFQKKKGYCMHYASAATVMFRAMGIPARYVEGYIITESDIQKSGTGEIDVKDQSAHAWVEIYMDGFGWIPVEVTPAYQQGDKVTLPKEIKQSNLKKKNQMKEEEAKVTATPTIAPTVKENKSIANDQKAGTNSSIKIRLPKYLIYVIKGLALLFIMTIIIIAILYIRYRYILKKRQKEKEGKNNSIKLLAQYHMFESIMREYHISYENTQAFDVYYEQFSQAFPEIKEDDLRRYISLALKAKYDCNWISEIEKTESASLYHKFISQVQKQSRKSKLLFWRYIKMLEV